MLRSRVSLWALLLSAAAACTTAPVDVPVDDQLAREATSILFWPEAVQIEGYRTIAQQFPTRRVAASAEPLPLPAANDPLDPRSIRFPAFDAEISLHDWLTRDRVVGAIVVHRGEVLHESYRFGNTAESPWISFSVAKSLTSMLIGAAIRDGYIASVDDPVADYLPLLRSSGYRDATIEDVLRMASGVAWDENYFDPNSDVSRAGGLNGLPLIRYMSGLQRETEPGVKFNYSTGETNLAGAVLRAAIGNNAAEYLTHRIWQPFGMEHDATWLLAEAGGGELGGCCLNATLRDYARIGLFALGGGVLADGKGVLADGWMRESVAPSPGYAGYGYLWWLGADSRFGARGIFGQMIHIDPKRELVIAFHGAWRAAVGRELGARRAQAVEAITAAVDARGGANRE
ncbi:MAG: serine hydrolase [Pseudomonadota bacterium]